MSEENEAVIKEIVRSIRKLVRAVSLDAQKMSKQYGLTGPQSSVLRNLINNGSMSSAALSRMMYVTPSNITGIIDRLEKKKLVERGKKEGDRRVALIALTEAGVELSKSIPDPIEKRFLKELAVLDTDGVRILSAAMNQILNLMDAKNVNETPLGASQNRAAADNF